MNLFLKSKYPALFLTLLLLFNMVYFRIGFCDPPDKGNSKIFYYVLAREAIKGGNYGDAALIGKKIVDMDPKDEAGYDLLVMSLLEMKNLPAVVGIVGEAERNGVRSAPLYERQADALFILGGFAAALIPLQKLEKLLTGNQSKDWVGHELAA